MSRIEFADKFELLGHLGHVKEAVPVWGMYTQHGPFLDNVPGLWARSREELEKVPKGDLDRYQVYFNGFRIWFEKEEKTTGVIVVAPKEYDLDFLKGRERFVDLERTHTYNISAFWNNQNWTEKRAPKEVFDVQGRFSHESVDFIVENLRHSGRTAIEQLRSLGFDKKSLQEFPENRHVKRYSAVMEVVYYGLISAQFK
jgi:hypothetical protein